MRARIPADSRTPSLQPKGSVGIHRTKALASKPNTMFGIFKKKKAIHKGGAKARKADGSGAGEDSKLTPVDQVKESVLRKEDEKDKKQVRNERV
eukprot:1356719-Amorphochlora_amoeboformis.AAC.1